jgi:plasmid stabilization system protein ParE
MLPIRVLDEARHDLMDALAYYREEDDALAERFAARYIAVVERCREFPDAGTRITALPKRHAGKDVRRFLLGDFPYKVIAARLPTSLVVIAVAHERRKPGFWRPRLAKVTP